MAKITLDQKIAKVDEQIMKEELIIEESRQKIKTLKSENKKLKTLKSERKKLTDEKEMIFANQIMKIIREKGINQEELLTELKHKENNTNEAKAESNNSDETVQSASVYKTST